MSLKSRKNNKGLDRLSNAVNILIKYGFQSFLVNTGLSKRKIAQQNFPDIDPNLNNWQRIRYATQDLGPTAVKLAKFLSGRPDILPDELITEFEKLEFGKNMLSKANAIEVFEQYTNRKADKTFQYFDNTSYLQDGFSATFRARLLSGEDVAVKILHPDTQSIVLADIALFKRLASISQRVLVNLGIPNPTGILDEFEREILPELDLSKEGDRIRRFNKAYHQMPGFVVPEIFNQYTSTNTLVSNYYNSTSVADAAEFTKWGLQQKEVADRFLKVFISGLLDTGLYLTQPVKEIVRLRPDGNIYFADYGTAGLLTTDQRAWIHDIVAGLSTRNSNVLADSMRKLANNSEVYDFQRFRSDIQFLADDLYFLESSDYYMREFSLGIMRIAYKHKLNIPREVVSAFNALAIAESIALSITPTCRIAELFKPYGRKLQLEKMQPDRLKSLFNKNLSQASDFLESSPLELSLILKKMRRGQFMANFSIKDFNMLLRRIDVSANKFCYIMLICTLVLSSSLIWVFAKGMYIFMYMPLPAFIGYATAALIALSLLIYNARTSLRKDEEANSHPTQDEE